MQYLLRKCCDENKTVAPAHKSGTVSADVYYENSEMDRVMKVSGKDRYVKVEPGITLNALSDQL